MLLLLNRLLDGLDGAVARAAGSTDLGGFLDITMDFLVYSAIPFAFVLKDPGNALAAAFLIFSFVGTMLGGIWADDSWGRFWGWDPKENGALLIVIWSAIVLHARFGGLAKERGIAALAIFGNVVTSWSWFGTNLLQEGLHSYGFSEAGFIALMWFVASQLLFIAIAYVPQRFWLSELGNAARTRRA